MAKTKSTESKANMVRAALVKFPDGKPTEIGAWIKEEYGVDLPANIISNYKSTMKKKGTVDAPGKRGRPALNGAVKQTAVNPLADKMKLPDVLGAAGTTLASFKTSLGLVSTVAEQMGGLEATAQAVTFWEEIEAGVGKLKGTVAAAGSQAKK